MIKIKEAIVVEGKYDKMRLSAIFDTLIIETNGFRIFKDKEKLALLRKLASKTGILIFTDSDSAGFVIRNYLSGALPGAKIKQAYLPDIYGKERRKEKPSKEGKLGVEGVSEEIIIRAIKNAGVELEEETKRGENVREITRADFYDDGIYGHSNSREKRTRLLAHFHLPEYLSVNAFITALNHIISYEEYKAALGELFGEDEK